MRGIQFEQILYREFSRVAIPGERVEIVADTSVMLIDGQLVHRTHSHTSDHYQDVVITGTDPEADAVALLAARRMIMALDLSGL